MNENFAPKSLSTRLKRALTAAVFTALIGLAAVELGRGVVNRRSSASPAPTALPDGEGGGRRVKAPELDGGVEWLNTAKPVQLKDLKGKIVLLDFWTYCCINCIHTLPDLAKLEKKYANELVVVGVHSGKFEREKSTESIKKAILRYQITHPVVNDADMSIWKRYGVSGWPTLVLIDPEGFAVYADSGEGQYAEMDRRIADLIALHRKNKTLDEKPMKFELAKDGADGPLYFPGKILADAAGDRLFIADSTHHRIVITDLKGKKIAVVGGGESGRADGAFAEARFNDPQGLALDGDLLYVADRKNDLIRAVDLKNKTVRTIAGTGKQGRPRTGGGPALEIGLNSPWDLLLHKGKLYIAMSGHHQIWTLDLARKVLAPFAGDGREQILDGAPASAEFAQPSGLATDGTNLFVADSEVSAVRSVPLDGSGDVTTLVGKGLFEFGDIDGDADTARLQHALGVAYHDGKVYVADTYNSKLRVIDLKTHKIKSLTGDATAWSTKPVFFEPGGLSYADGKLYVADTNAHRIRVVDLKTMALSTLALQGVEAPKSASH
jgi:thiol-disulfide isomerase/thioredoxin